MCVSSHHCLCSQWHAIWTFYCQNLDSGKKECSPLGRYPPPIHQTSKPWTCVSAFSFSPRRDAGSGSFHWLLQLRCGEGLRWVNTVDFPAGLMCWFHPCLWCRSLLTGFWVSHKRTWSMYYCWTWASVGKEGLKLPILLLCWCHCVHFLHDLTPDFSLLMVPSLIIYRWWSIHPSLQRDTF